jgi:protein O-GlcNAc transferase
MRNFGGNLDLLMRTALQCQKTGRLAEAEALYRQILQVNPQHAEALHYLGVLAGQVKQYDMAVSLIQQALALQPRNAVAHANLGTFLREKGRLAEAAVACRQAIALAPQNAAAHCILGHTLADQGHDQEAAAAYRQALALQPGDAPIHDCLGRLLHRLGQLDQAIASFRHAIALRGDFAQAYCHLGDALYDEKHFGEAIAAYQRAIALRPDYAAAYGSLGHALRSQGQSATALAAFRKAVALQGEIPEFHNSCGETLLDLHQVDEAVAAFRRAVALKPDYAQAHWNLGLALKDCGLLEEALAEYRQAAQLEPEKPKAHNSLLYLMHFHPGYDARAMAGELHRWNEHFAQPLASGRPVYGHERNPERRLRVGYVSPDFYLQAEAFFTVPLLEHHDRVQWEVHCYASVARPDAITARLQRAAAVWHDVRDLTDEHLAAQIRADGIDILVDLTMHMGNSRLLAFARRPAPLQVTWLAYPGSTGLETMDYRVSDWHIDPAGSDEAVYTEQTVRLPDCWCCYDPLEAVATEMVRERAAGPITLGCLNNPCKLNEATLRLWAQVLRCVPESRLLVRAFSMAQRQQIRAVLAQDGIDASRVEVAGYDSRQEHLALHQRIDVALDTLPYNGITTTCDALWMGVPVVSLTGQTAPGRAGKSLLTSVGLAELVCRGAAEFVQATARLCGDRQLLRELRQSLRGRVEASPLMDAPRFARNMEAAYRQMWRQWCARAGAGPGSTTA